MSGLFGDSGKVVGLFLAGLLGACAEEEGSITPPPDPADSRLLWVRQTHLTLHGISADEDRVYLSDAFITGGGVGAVHPETGATLWIGDARRRVGWSFVPIDRVIGVTHSDMLVGLSAIDGERIWARPVSTTETIASGEPHNLYVTDGEQLYAFDTRAGDRLWISPIERGGEVVLAAGAGLVCTERLVAPRTHARVSCYDPAAGTMLWSHYVYPPEWIAVTHSSVVVAGLEPGEGPGLMGLDLQTGEPIWKQAGIETEGSTLSAMGDVLYACGMKCFALHTNDGTVVWQTALGDQVGAPAVVNGMLFAVGRAVDGRTPLYVLSSSNGAILEEIVPDGIRGLCGELAVSGDIVLVLGCGSLSAYRIAG